MVRVLSSSSKTKQKQITHNTENKKGVTSRMWPKQQHRKLKRSNNTDVAKTTAQKTKKE
jgi:hypothetical protein